MYMVILIDNKDICFQNPRVFMAAIMISGILVLDPVFNLWKNFV